MSPLLGDDPGRAGVLERWRSSLGRRPPPHLLLFLASATLSALVFVLNPAGLHTPYGTGNGRWEDRVDSFSERLVVNRVIDDAFRDGPSASRFPFVTRGYPTDYSYYPEGGPYTTMFAGQVRLLSNIRAWLGLNSHRSVEALAHDARVTLAILAAILLAVFVARIAREYGAAAGVVAALVLASSGGFTLFAQNLYMVMPAFLLPLAAITLGYGRLSPSWLTVIAFFAALVNFLCRYEFATTFAVLSILPFFVFRRDDGFASKVRLAVLAMVAMVMAFVVVFALHLVVLGWETGGVASALRHVTSRVAVRSLSQQDVPPPLSIAFLKAMNYRWTLSGLAIPFTGVSFDQNAIMVGYLLSPLLVRPFDRRVLAPWGLGLFGYASWYLFSYQHIAYHRFYDWLIFAMGIVPAWCAVLALAVQRLHSRHVLSAVLVVLVLVVAQREGIRSEPAPAPLVAPPGARFEVRAEAWDQWPWRRGVRSDKGRTNLFVMADGGTGETTVGPGTKLFFEGTGVATVEAVERGQQGTGPSILYVTVDRNLWPERDGYPNAIGVY